MCQKLLKYEGPIVRNSMANQGEGPRWQAKYIVSVN